jgi:hypothetical protein
MIRATELNFEMFHGDTMRMAFTVVDHDTQLPVDITGCQITMSAKYMVKDSDRLAVFRKTTLLGGGIQLVNVSTGSVMVEVAPSDTAALPQKETELTYDVRIDMTDGQIYTLLFGTLLVHPSATGTPV